MPYIADMINQPGKPLPSRGTAAAKQFKKGAPSTPPLAPSNVNTSQAQAAQQSPQVVKSGAIVGGAQHNQVTLASNYLVDVLPYRMLPTISKSSVVGHNLNLQVCKSGTPGMHFFSVYGADPAELQRLLNLVTFAIGLTPHP